MESESGGVHFDPADVRGGGKAWLAVVVERDPCAGGWLFTPWTCGKPFIIDTYDCDGA